MTGQGNNLDILKGWLADVLLVTSFLTRLPVPLRPESKNRLLAEAAWAFPVAGLVVGAAGGLALLCGFQLGLHPLASSLLAIAASVLVSGALHEDGLADVADGFGGGREVEDKLRIMRDSRVGSYGVLAMVFSVGLRAAVLAGMTAPSGAALALIAAAAVSRGTVVAVMSKMDAARSDGLAAGAGKPSGETMMVALTLSAVAAFVLLGAGGWIALVAAFAAAAVMAGLARRQIGGQTGDALGAVQQVSEIAVLMSIGAMA